MSLVRVTRIDNKAVVHELKRLNGLLEMFLSHAYGLTFPTVAPKQDESEALFTSDLDTLKQELVDVDRGLNPLRPVGDDEDVQS